MASIRATACLCGVLLLLLTITASLHADRQSDLRTRSILPDIIHQQQLLHPDTAASAAASDEAAAAAQIVDYADDRIVATVLAATLAVLGTIGAPCGADLNRTFAAMGRREAWAIASECRDVYL